MAVVLSGIDSRTPAEIIFDLGIGDIFNGVAASIVTPDVLGSNIRAGGRRQVDCCCWAQSLCRQAGSH